MLTEHEIEFRVRYQETDAGGYVYHGNYFTWFEMGRTELLRASGATYRQMEQEGVFIVVVKAECRYFRPARYDDHLRLTTTVTRVTAARIEHDYRLHRGQDLLAEAHITLCAVDRTGVPQRLPDWLRTE
jgi:acyl-CoA thioester hydrolase